MFLQFISTGNAFVPTADEAADPEKQASIYTTISLVRHLLSSLKSSAYDSIFILPVVYVQRILGAPCPLYENTTRSEAVATLATLRIWAMILSRVAYFDVNNVTEAFFSL